MVKERVRVGGVRFFFFSFLLKNGISNPKKKKQKQL